MAAHRLCTQLPQLRRGRRVGRVSDERLEVLIGRIPAGIHNRPRHKRLLAVVALSLIHISLKQANVTGGGKEMSVAAESAS